jgi:hypothetical protein
VRETARGRDAGSAQCRPSLGAGQRRQRCPVIGRQRMHRRQRHRGNGKWQERCSGMAMLMMMMVVVMIVPMRPGLAVHRRQRPAMREPVDPFVHTASALS